MYVCVCKGITDADLIELTSRHATETGRFIDAMLDRASEALGVGTGCGCCLEFAGGLIEQQLEVEGHPNP